MNSILRATLFFAVLLYFLWIFILLKKKSLQLKYTLLWLLFGLVMLIILINPQFFISLIRKIGILDTNIGALAAVLFMVIVILMSFTSVISILDEKNKRLVQHVALLEKRIRELEIVKKRGDNNV